MANILIVDDNDEVAALFQAILEEAGHKVDRAPAAYGAILRAVRMTYDIVVMDLLLIGANGAVTALALRGLGMMGPILVITGGAMPIDKAVYDRAGFAGKLLKPVTPAELVSEVQKALDEHARARIPSG